MGRKKKTTRRTANRTVKPGLLGKSSSRGEYIPATPSNCSAPAIEGTTTLIVENNGVWYANPAVGELGPELIKNGKFTADGTDWAMKNANISFANHQLIKAVGGVSGIVRQDIGIASGWYHYVADIDEVTSNSFIISVGAPSYGARGNTATIGGAGISEGKLLSPGIDSSVEIRGVGPATWVCNSVSIKATVESDYTYQWQRNGLDIIGGVGPAYTVVGSDGGLSITCVVTAHNIVGSSSAVSNTIIPA